MRLTAEEREALQQLEELFGKDFYDFTICLFTGGSTFYKKQRRNWRQNKTVLTFEEEIFSDKRSENKGGLGPVVRKCKGGVVLFDNLERDHMKRTAMVEELLQKVEELKKCNKGMGYDMRIFHQVREKARQAAKQQEEDFSRQKEKKEEQSTHVKKESFGCKTS